MTTRYVFSENDVSRQREINSRVERITGSIPQAASRHKESPVSEAGSAEYVGYFKVVKASDTTVAIVDGADPTNVTCGYYEHGIQRVAVSKPEAITVTATGFIYVIITYTTVYVFTFAFGTTLPASQNGSIVRKIADVTFADGKITAITQAQQGILITPGVF